MARTMYDWLMVRAEGDSFDAHCLACAMAARCEDPRGTLAQRLGLAEGDLRALLERHFGGADVAPLCKGRAAGHVEPAIEEDDLQRLLLDHRAGEADIEVWLAAIIARAAQHPHHLWQDLGLTGRDDVSRLMARHFPGLKALNVLDMKWKKFFYKQLCEREEIRICKAPNCTVCSDYIVCFGPEDGAPLLDGPPVAGEADHG